MARYSSPTDWPNPDNLALALPAALALQSPVPADPSPAAVYLASLGEGSRRTRGTALNTIGTRLGMSVKADVLLAHGHF